MYWPKAPDPQEPQQKVRFLINGLFPLYVIGRKLTREISFVVCNSLFEKVSVKLLNSRVSQKTLFLKFCLFLLTSGAY